MLTAEIIINRLINQQIAASRFQKPADLVRWMVAMQAQEYAMAKWAIGLRLPGSNDEDVEDAFSSGEILRTHIMRPTWHFVSAEDIRWMVMLTAPRVHQSNAFTYRQMELDKDLLMKSVRILEKALSGGKNLSREVLNHEFKKNSIIADGIRLSAIMMYAELEAVICSGPRQGKQFTYALLEERVKPVKNLHPSEALHKLTSQYFRSRGPATIQDFTTWSGLTIKEAREGIAALDDNFAREEIDGKIYIFQPQSLASNSKQQTSFLMPDYDEYGMSYKDRSAIFNPKNKGKSISRDNPVFNRMIILNGKIEGTWTRRIKGTAAQVETYPFNSLNKKDSKLLSDSVNQYVTFTENLNRKK